MEVDIAKQVAGILITHWHSDHIEGAFARLEDEKISILNASLTPNNDNWIFHKHLQGLIIP